MPRAISGGPIARTGLRLFKTGEGGSATTIGGSVADHRRNIGHDAIGLACRRHIVEGIQNRIVGDRSGSNYGRTRCGRKLRSKSRSCIFRCSLCRNRLCLHFGLGHGDRLRSW